MSTADGAAEEIAAKPTSSITTPTKLLVLDFDGTVCLGDAPVLSYARHADAALAERDPAHADGFVEHVVALFLSGPDAVAEAADRESGDEASAPEVAAALAHVVDSADGYAATAALARSRGAQREDLDAAYEASRRELAAGLLETWAPPGLADFLGRSRERADVVLVTNATETGVAQQLAHFGLKDAFDEIVTSAGKPDGMPAILRRLRQQRGLADAPERLASVGDIWRNDLAPAADQGSATALIERFAAPDAQPTFRAPTFEELYAPLEAWLSA
ncbi:HAD family hydrolase [Frondihabitans australicus]|uniref:FMN phosphatase YigB (HAD superfamily) n=1 Tax=Frondihabitans australicus TaxID=386892 RepID=A0A495IG84_9MICO|nr:HAD family hydrolase [Frondihabitans australicus]RKR75033.1 FMN phosphatase YigB (HAD superfamily) [Frondihabitans australicus]